MILLSNPVTARGLCLVTQVILIHCHSPNSDLSQNHKSEVSWLSREKLQKVLDEIAASASLIAGETHVPQHSLYFGEFKVLAGSWNSPLDRVCE